MISPFDLKPRHCISRVVGVVLIVVGALVASCLYVVLTDPSRTFRALPAAIDLPAAVDAYRKMGLPWKADEVESGRGLPEDRNAADIIRLCGSELKRDNAFALLKRAESLRGSDQAEQCLKPLEEELSMGEEAARIGSVHFDHDWDKDVVENVPTQTTFRALAKMFAFRAEAEASRGQVGASIKDLGRVRTLSRMAGQDEEIRPVFDQLSCTMIGFKAEKYCIERWAKDANALQQLAVLEAEPPAVPDLRQALRGEAYFYVAVCRNMDAKGLYVTGGTPKHDGLPEDELPRAYLDRSLHFWIDMFGVLERDKSKPTSSVGELERVMRTYTRSRSPGDKFLAHCLSHPDIYPAVDEYITDFQAETLALRALVQALIIRSRTGAFPRSISQISGRWADPYTGKPLGLALIPGGIKIYSVGVTGRGKGEDSREAQEADQFDIVASYP